MSTESKWEIEYGDHPEAGRIEGDGFTVRIMYDECPESPRDMSDCYVGHMLCAHPNYNLGDEQADQPFSTEIECDGCDNGEIENDRGEMESCPKCDGYGEITLGIYEFLQREYGATVVLPLFLYDHSGISMSCGSNMGSTDRRNRVIGDSHGWDVSSVGFIFDTPETRERTGCEGEHIEAALRAEVDEYDSYLRGDVYGVVVEIPGINTGHHMLDCWGFVGQEWAEQQARESADDAEQIVAKERAERADWQGLWRRRNRLRLEINERRLERARNRATT